MEMTLRQIVLEGVLALTRETEFYKVQRRLNSLVRPEDRLDDEQLVRKIRGTVLGTKGIAAAPAQ
jgi:hypothetical protein